jgi:16S rRNA (cytosine1402-N4)-methyltransferase
MRMDETKHISVLLEEAVESLHLEKGMVVVDATLGGGGHARAVLERILPGGRLIAIDADAQALERFRKRALSESFFAEALRDGALVLVHGNYSDLGGALEGAGATVADAILADLGFSSDQIEAPERGFSFQKEGPLDMRLDQGSELSAETIVNEYAASELEKIFRAYGEETESHRIAQMISTEREKQPIKTTKELADLILRAYPAGKRRAMKIHPATKVFQALRIAVNREYEHLEMFLEETVERLSPGGRLAVITFHSGEDRIVKQFFRNQSLGCVCPVGFPVCRCGHTATLSVITKRPMAPSETEIVRNPRARSAKLRIAERV